MSFATRIKNLNAKQLLLLASGIACVVYLASDPIGPRNGDTWLGYVLGSLAALVVVALLLLGARRRWWINALGSQQEWVAFHVLLGCLLIPLVLLHSGFQTGNGLHAVLFVIMLLDVASGFYGLYLYQTQPKKLRGLSDGGGATKLRESLGRLDAQLLDSARGSASETYCALVSAIQRTWLPQSLQALLFTSDKSHMLQASSGGYQLVSNAGQANLLALLSRQGADSQLIGRVRERNQLILAYRRALVVEFIMGNWLKVHLQLSLAFLALLIVHIVVVLIY